MKKIKNPNTILLYGMVLVYMAAGVLHLVRPDFYLLLIPVWIPFPLYCIIISGIAEILLATLLLSKRYRSASAWIIILMLVLYAVLIHIPMVIEYHSMQHPHLWLAIIRLPLQIILIWWAWLYTKGT